MRVKESLNVRFDESQPLKSSSLVDDDILKSEIIENQGKDLEIKENEPLNKEILNIKETKDHPIDSVIVACNKYGYVNMVQGNSQKRTRERMSDQEAKEIKAEAREIMPQPSTVNCS
ncbi:hypothetical protein Tco_0768241 [Tanacetum coccineum]